MGHARTRRSILLYRNPVPGSGSCTSLVLSAPAVLFAEKGKTGAALCFGASAISTPSRCCPFGVAACSSCSCMGRVQTALFLVSYGHMGSPCAWQYMASEEQGPGVQGLAAYFMVLFAQLAYVAIMLLVGFFGISLPGAVAVFAGFLLIAFAINMTVSWAVLSEAKRLSDKRSARKSAARRRRQIAGICGGTGLKPPGIQQQEQRSDQTASQAEWFILVQNKEAGPFTVEEMKQKAATGTLRLPVSCGEGKPAGLTRRITPSLWPLFLNGHRRPTRITAAIPGRESFPLTCNRRSAGRPSPITAALRSPSFRSFSVNALRWFFVLPGALGSTRLPGFIRLHAEAWVSRVHRGIDRRRSHHHHLPESSSGRSLRLSRLANRSLAQGHCLPRPRCIDARDRGILSLPCPYAARLEGSLLRRLPAAWVNWRSIHGFQG